MTKTKVKFFTNRCIETLYKEYSEWLESKQQGHIFKVIGTSLTTKTNFPFSLIVTYEIKNENF